MSIARRAVNNVFWLFLSEVCARVTMFVGTVYLARVLGAAGFGVYSLALAVAMYMWVVVDAGVTGYGVREVARDVSRAGELLNSLNSLRVLLAVVCLVLLAGGLSLLDFEGKWVILAGGGYVFSYALSPNWMLRGLEKMQYLAFANVVVGIFFLGSVYFLAKSPADTLLAAACRSLAVLLGSILTLLFMKRGTNICFSFCFSPSAWWKHLQESWYFMLNLALNVFARFIPLFFLGIWGAAETLGFFSVSHRTVLLLLIIGLIVNQSSYPILSSLYPRDKRKFYQTQRLFQKLIIYIGIPIGVVGTLLSDEIITLLYGNSYLKASGILKLMIWFVPLTFLRADYDKSLLSAGLQKADMLAKMVGTTLVVMLCVLLIPRHGAYGAALAMVLGELATVIVVAAIFAAKLQGAFPLDVYLFKVVVASMLAGALVERLSLPLAFNLAAAVVAYGLLSLLLGMVEKDDIIQLCRVVMPGGLGSGTEKGQAD